MKSADFQKKIASILMHMESVAIAVSGGVDSMTLAHIAKRTLNVSVTMFHALSPAVPREATERIERHAKNAGWQLELINANEMQDPNYLENPVNRCFFCKSNLYSRIAQFTSQPILSGTNLDDLSDFRPGLEAAKDFEVRHPFVEANIGKRDIRLIAEDLGLDDIKQLPAAPCLSSRIETGLHVTNEKLMLIDSVERLLQEEFGLGIIRCRVKRVGIVIELEETLLNKLDGNLRKRVDNLVGIYGHNKGVEYSSYKQGSAFLREKL